jgi:peptidoglycan/xylan/chitin deacetylase (PgdA/CDA1 family)
MLPILMYHQIDRIPPKVDSVGVRAQFRSLIVSPASFARQMWLLKQLGYRGVSMGEVMLYLMGEKTVSQHGKVVGISFDDGYQNNLIHALPVLQKYGFHSTCYVVSRMAGQRNEWDAADPQSGVLAKSLMTALEMRQWIAAGQEIGSHTCHHVNLNEVDDETAYIEIKQSKEQLQAMTGVACEHFCYPYGQYESRHAAMAKAAGYVSATTTQYGLARRQHSAFELPRIGVMKNTNLFQLWRTLR